uniref:Uncharacterized protein n=1 Tax=Tanacetum cinerariifolium TaxID=118510 RepID=A0A699ULE3_TANCI|nr:hypothetical protein [Tanacetum cinerariifolium]
MMTVLLPDDIDQLLETLPVFVQRPDQLMSGQSQGPGDVGTEQLFESSRVPGLLVREFCSDWRNSHRRSKPVEQSQRD